MMAFSRNSLSRHLWILILGLFLLPILPLCGYAAEIHVPLQVPTIQGAIDAAQDGDKIVVQPGLYPENINFRGKAILLTGTNPLDPAVVTSTIIDGNMKGSVVTFNSGETGRSVLTGFTIRNGSGTLRDEKRYGGGIYCGLRSAPTIRHNKIVNNTADVGGAIYVEGNAPPSITNGPVAAYPCVGVGKTVGLSVTATDRDGDTLLFTWTPREGGTITGTGDTVLFSATTPGLHTIDLTVDDQHGETTRATVTVTVIGVNIQIPLPQLLVGQGATLSAVVTPAIVDSPEYPVGVTWSVLEGPAAGLFDPSINGKPSATSIMFTPSTSGPGRIQAEYRVGSAKTAASVAIALTPVILTVDPGSGIVGTTVQTTIKGYNLGRVTAVSLSGEGVSAAVKEGKTEDTLPVQFVISQNAEPGDRTLILTTAEGSFNTLATFKIKPLPAITANPNSLTLIVGDTGTITFSVPDPAPSGGWNLILSSSVPIVATVPSSLTIPEGQTSAGVTVTAVGFGTTTITANLTGYTKAQVPVTVLNPPLITFSASPLSVALGLVEKCTVTISNPAPAAGLVVTLTGGEGTIQIPATVTIPESQTSSTFSAKGLLEGSATITASATGYPAANLQVNVPLPQFNLFPGYLPVAKGRSSSLQLSIPNRAPAGGLTVNLASSNTAIVTTPATVTIPEDAKSVSVALNGVSAGSATVTASLTGIKSAQATVNVLEAYNISFDPGSLTITPATSKTTDVVVSSPAPEGGLTVILSNPSQDKISVPASVFIPEGKSRTPVTVSGLDATSTPVIVNASCPGLTDGQLSVTVQPRHQPWIMADVTVGAGTRTTGAVGLTGATAPPGGYTINLTSTDPLIAGVPAEVTIPGGSSWTSFTIAGKSVGTTDITASAAGFTAKNTVTVVKSTFTWAYVPTQMTLGATRDIQVQTYVPNGSYYDYYYGNPRKYTYSAQVVAQALTVTLSNQNPAVIQVPASATIPAGYSYSNSFNIQASGTGASTLTASASGWDSKTSDAITVIGPWLKADITVGAGCRSTGAVGLTGGTAPAAGYTINLTSSDPAIATVPATVTIPEGYGSTTFPIVGKSVGTTDITGSVSGFSASSAVTVVKPTFAWSNVPTQMTLGARQSVRATYS